MEILIIEARDSEISVKLSDLDRYARGIVCTVVVEAI